MQGNIIIQTQPNIIYSSQPPQYPAKLVVLKFIFHTTVGIDYLKLK
jgi:hypothetical protein